MLVGKNSDYLEKGEAKDKLYYEGVDIFILI